mmetsp:Transcript_21969/g.73890  ORF Transcript_21969/g.73890 Transcript_21969/m.73890 type:complete len:184 (-) Transcript_21969:207-758(-)
MSNNPTVKYETIPGSRCLSNYVFATVLFSAGIAFFLAGLSSYFKLNLIPFADLTGIFFLPQGITLLFYGTAATCLSVFIWLTIFLDIGSGLNTYDVDKGSVTIFRKGFLGRNRTIEFTYPIEEIESIRLKSAESFNSIPAIYLCMKDRREIPLTNLNSNPTIREVEERAANLAKFLNVYLDGM